MTVLKVVSDIAVLDLTLVAAKFGQCGPPRQPAAKEE